MTVVRPGRNAAAYREIDVSRLQIKIIKTRQQVNATRSRFGVPAGEAWHQPLAGKRRSAGHIDYVGDRSRTLILLQIREPVVDTIEALAQNRQQRFATGGDLQTSIGAFEQAGAQL